MKLKLAFFSLALLVSGCASNSPVTDYDVNYDFAAVNQFQWQSPAEVSNPLTHEKVKDAIINNLTQKGLYEADPSAIKVTAYNQLIEKPKNTGFSVGIGGGSYGSSGGVGGSVRVPVGGNSEVHQFVRIDFVSSANQKLIWRGEASRAWVDGDNADKKQQIITQLVNDILAKFPPDND
ncbi:DUF4136 domain-containing protein [Paraferrimonas sedimenticola]|uniref:DUF4136 domain-containing protein n=1 Tax=Paraferrimonas sedimenticola TaxID=375674 RepID=A0AA37RYL8_9GAMM|nr:DUF4136 domain-containing protein [Paraferrimonas sedimenticola]GLP97334.1 hypothetical protein GCM10007895_26410 [Paraferrimonas sedimenticola]